MNEILLAALLTSWEDELCRIRNKLMDGGLAGNGPFNKRANGVLYDIRHLSNTISDMKEKIESLLPKTQTTNDEDLENLLDETEQKEFVEYKIRQGLQ